MAGEYAAITLPQDAQQKAVELYAETGSYSEVARRLGFGDHSVARRILKSPQGSFALEQLLRERHRARVIKLGAITERYIAELDTALQNGNERIVGGRRDGDPLTVFLRPEVKDIVSALAWLTYHQRELSDQLSTVDVTSHDVSLEARAQNLNTLRELVAAEERRINAQRQSDCDASSVAAPADSPAAPATTANDLVPVHFSPAPAAVAPLIQKGASSTTAPVGDLLPGTGSHDSSTHPPGRGKGRPESFRAAAKKQHSFDRPVEGKRSPGGEDIDGPPRGMIREVVESEVGWDDLA